jgi:photosystem II stability/assembly factor-like uncharacterized protein
MLACGSLLGSNPELVGPFGGSAAVVAVDAHRAGTVLAATSNALLFRSTNGGESWMRVPFPAELHATLHAFVVIPRTGVYLAGLADDSGAYSGIFRSADAGQSWTRLTGLGSRDVWSLAVSPMNGRVIAAGVADGVFLSRDGGERWARISPESNVALKPVVSLAFDIVDSQILYAGTPHLPWKTADGGKTWEPAHTGMHDDSDIFSLHVDQTRPLRLFAAACSGMYHSADQGSSWTRITEASGASSRSYYIIQDAAQPDIMYAGTARGLVKSTDRGRTWRRLSTHTTRSIAIDSTRPGRIYVATDEAGLFRSDDYGESLAPANKGFCNRRVLSFAASEDALYVSSSAVSGSGGVYRRADAGDDWEDVAPQSPADRAQILRIVPLDTARLYAITPGGLLFSGDAARTWGAVVPPPTNSRLTALLVPEADGRRIVVATEDEGIYVSDDMARTWSPARAPAGETAVRSLVVLAPRLVAAITSSALLLSQDGMDFNAVPLPAWASAIHGVVATDNGLLAATSSGLARSDRYGSAWRRVPGILNGSTLSAICAHPTRRGVLFASRYGGIYGSVDNGQSWTPVIAEGQLKGIQELVVTAAKPDTLYAITRNQGVYAIPVRPMTARGRDRSAGASDALRAGGGM